MKDEIKEILELYKNDDIEYYNLVSDLGYDKLLDYITNLQARIDKAIEYIKTELITDWAIKNDGYVSGSDLPADAITPILNILTGGDEE